ncbi:hypothetical protein [Siphonobacter sp. SORGH_AS_0500]|uniref:hypothetical protein n=1 Tax=Siphonobacter sp. SORGH_AS_0500 TaxID=1864824 RepID=UPI00285FEC5B|nr:hypothetical protein [Siphonobacter sp. SORGH_AS_0500]MDR6196695.1 hypothetical protein [Siphonobacter sp. SORGH_AS_0500]
MAKFFIYNASIEDSKYKTITVIFNPYAEFDFNALSDELFEYFQYSYQTSALVFINCESIVKIATIVSENIEKIFKSIPKVEEVSLRESIFYISYNNSKYNINKSSSFLKNNINEIVRQGLVSIFIENGGLVESNGIAHHYVFPSGKHSSKFLRTANVLASKSEIDFIALNTLHRFKKVDFNNIYCDTLSINVIGYSINQYLKRYGMAKDINIESFKSYEGLYSKNYKFYDNSIFLISASTSGRIVNYIKKNNPEIYSENICVLFYLPLEQESSLDSERVLCNLEYNARFDYGIHKYEQFRGGELCKFCCNKSSPIKIVGDSFNLEEPIVNTRNIIASKYITKSLKDFVSQFKHNSDNGTSLKISYSENSVLNKKYNVYIDYENIIKNIDKEHYKEHKYKINSYIDQYIPASLKYIVYLNDEGSKLLAQYIHEKTTVHSKVNIKMINHIDLNEDSVNIEDGGAILIVGSCITNGKNLLYLSRFFRNYDQLRIVYFIAINRISDPDKNKELKSNLKYGLYGPENSTFIEIETLNCDNSNHDKPWVVEQKYLKNVRSELDYPLSLLDNRIEIINGFSNVSLKGGSDNIFYNDYRERELKIRKNSAFFSDNNYFDNVTQSDVYFTISCVLNNMRNNKIDGLFQTNFVKNLLDPFVFSRFNDGIIQASILRSAKYEELNYSFSYKNSEDMLMLLKTIIKHKDQYQGEAIFEFLYAVAIGKLRLVREHYLLLIADLEVIDNDKVNMFTKSIKSIYEDNIQ